MTFIGLLDHYRPFLGIFGHFGAILDDFGVFLGKLSKSTKTFKNDLKSTVFGLVTILLHFQRIP